MRRHRRESETRKSIDTQMHEQQDCIKFQARLSKAGRVKRHPAGQLRNRGVYRHTQSRTTTSLCPRSQSHFAARLPKPDLMSQHQHACTRFHRRSRRQHRQRSLTTITSVMIINNDRRSYRQRDRGQDIKIPYATYLRSQHPTLRMKRKFQSPHNVHKFCSKRHTPTATVPHLA